MIGDGARERPARDAEQLRLEQRIGDRAAVDGDERLARAGAVAVDRPGDQLLPDAAFADNQHRRGGVGRVRDLLVDLAASAPSGRSGCRAGSTGISAAAPPCARRLLERAIDDAP